MKCRLQGEIFKNIHSQILQRKARHRQEKTQNVMHTEIGIIRYTFLRVKSNSVGKSSASLFGNMKRGVDFMVGGTRAE